MTKALKAIMIIYGALFIIMGLVEFIAPELSYSLQGFQNPPIYIHMYQGVSAVCFIVSGIWIIVAGRDPQRNLNLVKFAITLSALLLANDIFMAIRGYFSFIALWPLMAIDVIFGILLLVFYPWRQARSSIDPSVQKQ